MRGNSVVLISIALFIILASLYETSEGFMASLTARRDQLKVKKKKEKLEEERIERRLQKLQNREKAVARKLQHLKKWVKKFKSSQRTKVSFYEPLKLARA